jgi:hypothetical protein
LYTASASYEIEFILAEGEDVNTFHVTLQEALQAEYPETNVTVTLLISDKDVSTFQVDVIVFGNTTRLPNKAEITDVIIEYSGEAVPDGFEGSPDADDIADGANNTMILYLMLILAFCVLLCITVLCARRRRNRQRVVKLKLPI